MKFKKLGDFAYIKGRIGWKGLKKKEYLSNSDYRIINGSNIVSGKIDWTDTGYIDKYRYDESPEIRLEQDDILITKDGTIGKIAKVNNLNKPTTIASGLFLLRNKDNDHWDTDYLYWFLNSMKFTEFIHARTEGSVIPHLYQKDFEELQIPEISIDEQKKISKKLNTIQKKIELNNNINDNLLMLCKELFKRKFPNVYSGYSTIGEITNNFDRNRIPLSKNQRNRLPGKYRYIGATSTLDYISKYNFNGTYVLLGEDGSVIDRDDHPILQYVSGKFWPNNHTHVLQGKGVSTEWIFLYFSSVNVKSIVTGAVQLKINQKNLNSLKVSVPTPDSLKEFENMIEPIFKKIRLKRKENQILEDVKEEILLKYL
jgi:type I restriction enzyme S subunit